MTFIFCLFRVKASGYYFFIFNNENEVKNNFIHAHFAINKTVYDTSAAVASCKNESKECSLPLTFWSQERTILQLPNPSDDTLWNEEFIFVSKCEPRSLLYLICFMSIPLCLILFAFTWLILSRKYGLRYFFGISGKWVATWKVHGWNDFMEWFLFLF